MPANLESIEQAIKESEAPPSFLNDDTRTVTTAGTRVCLVDISTPCKEVIITAKTANTGYIYVGSPNVSSTRYLKRLNPGESIVISIDDLNKIYLDTSVSAEGVLYGYVR